MGLGVGMVAHFVTKKAQKFDFSGLAAGLCDRPADQWLFSKLKKKP
jgi:hypothetical protein